jgi:mRNA interferase MazF
MAREEYRFGEIVLVDYPFSDGIQSKLRPGLVLTQHEDDDVLVARITSVTREAAFDVALRPSAENGLMFPSAIRVNKIATLLPNLIQRRIGYITAEEEHKVVKTLHRFADSLKK